MELPANTRRIEYLDYAKGFGIFMLMMAHTIMHFSTLPDLFAYICTFNVSIFFVIAGTLANYRQEKAVDVKAFIIKRTKTLLVPYVFFSLFNSALVFAVLFVRHGLTSNVIHSELIQLLISGNGSVWFLVTLFSVEAIFYMLRIYRIFQLGPVQNIVFSLSAIAALILTFSIGSTANPFGMVFLRILAAFGYYFAGIVLGGLIKKTKNYLLFPGAVLVATGLIMQIFNPASFSFFDAEFYKPVPSIITSIAGASGYILIFAWLDKRGAVVRLKKILSYYGKNSLIVMLIHLNLLLCITYPFGEKLWAMKGVLSYFSAAGVFVFIVFLAVPFVWLINNKLPFLIGKPMKKKL